jgi:acetylglutamate kinase
MLIVLKYGGNAMVPPPAPDLLLDEVAVRVAAGDRVVLVHGGGPQIDTELNELGLAQQRVSGLRVTDAATLAVTERVLCGTVNKALVRALRRRGVDAVGISGQDGGLLLAQPVAPIDGKALGFVGEIQAVHRALLDALLGGGFTPVVAPLALASDGSSALNVNADTAAGALAGALAADAYVVVTNVERVRLRVDDPSSAIETLDIALARRYLADGTFDGGMAPKMESIVRALEAGAKRAVVCGSGPGALSAALNGNGTIVTV